MGKGRRLPEFKWDVYRESYKLINLNELDWIESHWKSRDSDDLPGPFLVVPWAAVRWPATPEVTIAGPPSPPWRGYSRCSGYPKTPPSRRYSPLAQRSLYRTFAGMDIGEGLGEAMLRFAQRYGHLGMPHYLGRDERSHDPLTNHIWGEPVSIWLSEIHHLRTVVEIWGRLENRDQDWIRERIKFAVDENFTHGNTLPTVRFDSNCWRGSEHLRFDEPMLGRMIAHPSRPEASMLLRSRDHFLAAQVLVDQIINERLEHYTSVRVLHDGGDRALHIVPLNLLGAIWLQFARATEGRWPYRRCDTCGEWRQVAPQGRDRRHAFCSSSCRGKYFREASKRERPESASIRRATPRYRS